jgi:hypothetical protein
MAFLAGYVIDPATDHDPVSWKTADFRLTPQTLSDLCDRASGAAVAAYDGEGFVMWEDAGGQQ